MTMLADTLIPALDSAWQRQRKIDVHMHVHGPGYFESLDNARIVATADALGIEKMLCSVPISGGRLASMDEVRACNDATLQAMCEHPGRILGYCFLIPGHFRASRDELLRCLDAGMIGIKLYNQYRYSDPVLDPIAELAIEYGVPILGHAGHPTDRATQAAQPLISDASHFVALARRHPQVMLIEGHIAGGGDWEWSLKALRDCPNVYLDTSGSGMDDAILERCVAEIGVERVLFATDMTMEGGVARVLGADLTDAQREAIFWKNAQAILDRKRS